MLPINDRGLEAIADRISKALENEPDALKMVIGLLRYLHGASCGYLTMDRQGKHVNLPNNVESELPQVIATIVIGRLTFNLRDMDGDAERAILVYADAALDELRSEIAA